MERTVEDIRPGDKSLLSTVFGRAVLGYAPLLVLHAWKRWRIKQNALLFVIYHDLRCYSLLRKFISGL
jgi:hypothetical protein